MKLQLAGLIVAAALSLATAQTVHAAEKPTAEPNLPQTIKTDDSGRQCDFIQTNCEVCVRKEDKTVVCSSVGQACTPTTKECVL